ncbi:MAG: NlpC/P60 family protein [Candidatus Saccharimonadales bacterium]
MMNNEKQFQTKPKKLVKKTYLKLIRNSVGSRMFRNLYISIDNRQKYDATKNGELSCAFYVSAILVIFGLIKNTHGTIQRTQEDLEEVGWIKTDQPNPGDIIIWEADKDSHNHIGFYVGRNKAISNNSLRRKITMHDYTFNHTRKIEIIYSNPSL